MSASGALLAPPSSMSVRGTARGIGVRALILIIGIVLIGVWLVSLALKIASAAIHLLLWLGLLLLVAGAFAVLRHRRR